MRRYDTTTVPAYIRQKNDVGTKYGKPLRPLTAEDFEIVPEHEEQQLVEVCCDICGTPAEYFEPRMQDSYESSLLSIQLYKGIKDRPDEFMECTADFIDDYWYEVCESCMRHMVLPALKALRRMGPIESPPPPEEESAVISGAEDLLRLNRRPQGPLIGEEEAVGHPAQMAPLSDDEPF